MARLCLCLLPLICCCLTGCGLMQMSRDMTTHMYRSFRPSTDDPFNDHEKVNPQDIENENIMLEARQGIGPSREPDKWWSDYLMSEKSRSIERSLGVEYE